MNGKRLGAALLASMAVAAAAAACNVPVFRYALERWPPNAHTVSVASNIMHAAGDAMADHHANLWLTAAPPGQTSEVAVSYADDSGVWYEGDWEPGLLVRLADSPLRRRIAHDLVTGAAAAVVLIESPGHATNAAVYAMLREQLDRIARDIELPRELDYADETDGWTGSGSGRALSDVPVTARFTLHRVPYPAAREDFFVRQVRALDDAFASPATPAVAIVFGCGRMIPLSAAELDPELLGDVCQFLCSACSCRIKALNPGVDLLTAANWDAAVHAYPNPAPTVLPDGSTFQLGGTGSVTQAAEPVAPQAAAAAAAEPRRSPADRRNLTAVLGVLAAVILAGLAWLLISRPKH
jgi:hypothetical protein